VRAPRRAAAVRALAQLPPPWVCVERKKWEKKRMMMRGWRRETRKTPFFLFFLSPPAAPCAACRPAWGKPPRRPGSPSRLSPCRRWRAGWRRWAERRQAGWGPSRAGWRGQQRGVGAGSGWPGSLPGAGSGRAASPMCMNARVRVRVYSVCVPARRHAPRVIESRRVFVWERETNVFFFCARPRPPFIFLLLVLHLQRLRLLRVKVLRRPAGRPAIYQHNSSNFKPPLFHRTRTPPRTPPLTSPARAVQPIAWPDTAPPPPPGTPATA